MGASRKRGPASVPAQPSYELKLTLKIEGFRDDCTTCCGLADQLIAHASTGDLHEASETLKDIEWHVVDEDHPAAVS